MRGLSGDFSTMPLRDLVAYLGGRRATGTLRVIRAGVRKLILVRAGQVISASSNQPREFLGQFLINMGHLSEEQFSMAFATQRETQVPLGKIIVMTGLVSEPTVRATLSLKFRETLLDMFRWEEGEFSFDAGAVAEVEGVDARVDLTEVRREGDFRETAWQSIRAAFPSGNLYLTVDEGRLPEPPKPGTLDAKLVKRIREGLTIDELARVLHASDFLVYQRLYALYRLEAVKVSATPPPGRQRPTPSEEDEAQVVDVDVIGTESPTSEVIQAAQSFLENGNFRDGEALARRAHEMAPTPETEALLRSAEAALVGMLRREMVDRPQVPSLEMSAAQLKSLQLSTPERYLLSRIDGKRDLGAIISMSPLKELEALKYFQAFVDGGLVKLTPR
ncbi:DUF4388 domain-containing protein [Archangium violaceum]|uniref:PatA-like N-terminal domain-containing protein n=1 Tax=Archangium violaceum Cb vi76 TaxID=1406225 RepID=A0A084SSH5_9BACT|nr:DUF4388 domain-containing protein [Archangium violaceum]KFA91410.1 hypothetical protein Q664_21570 [Archangium violaceum Cb vi76]